jgi:hypothetical protein
VKKRKHNMKEYSGPCYPYEHRCPGCTLELTRTITLDPLYRDLPYLTYEDIEGLESERLVCPSGCGYTEVPAEKLFTVNPLFHLSDDAFEEPKPPQPIQLLLPLEFPKEQPQLEPPPPAEEYHRKRQVRLTTSFPLNVSGVYNSFLLFELKANGRRKKK